MSPSPQSASPPPAPDPGAGPAPARSFDAVIFDMDGVVTDTAAVHSLAWKRMFDEYLRARARRHGGAFEEFSPERDYRAYVDGKPRYQGVASFLASRGIELPLGTPADAPARETVCGLGNRKNELFNQIVGTAGARVYGSTLVLLHDLREAGIKIGLATSSRNAALILARSQTAPLFATVVDGIVSERLGLPGKPQPDIFIAACANLRVPCARAVVVEDAVAGVRAGAAGGFALVIGVAREGNAPELHAAGADLAAHDLAEVNLAAIDERVRLKRDSV